MRDLFYTELAKCMTEINTFESSASKEQILPHYERLLTTIENIVKLSCTARREGLLALEEAANHFSDDNGGKYLKNMIMLVVDGTDPELVEEICLTRYITSNLRLYDALNYLLLQAGTLSIQAGENPRVIEEKLFAMAPEAVEELHQNKEKEKEEKINSPEEIDMSEVEKLYEGNLALTPSDEGYFALKLLDYTILHLDDRNIQRVLRDIDNCDLGVVMKGLSGAARQCIFKNMSKRLCVMIAEDMHFMGYVKVYEVTEIAGKILTIIVKLMDAGEINETESDAIQVFHHLFEIESKSDKEKNAKIQSECNELHALLRDYESGRNRVLP